MKKVFLAILVAVAGLVACESTEEESTSETAGTTGMVPVATQTAGDTTGAGQGSPVAVPPTAVPSVVNVTPPVVPIAPVNSGAKLNPAHGQPGHRCDIAVGAPLPQGGAPTAAVPPPAPAAAPVQNIIPTPPAAPVLKQTAPATGKLNPAHGQPGHRCDIAVGAPLPSGNAPANAAPAPQPAPAPAQNIIPAPPPAPVLKQTAPGSVKVNPAHGQPGHRCDIAVGAPLN